LGRVVDDWVSSFSLSLSSLLIISRCFLSFVELEKPITKYFPPPPLFHSFGPFYRDSFGLRGF